MGDRSGAQASALVGAAIVAAGVFALWPKTVNAETSQEFQDTSDVPMPADDNPYIVPENHTWQDAIEDGFPVQNDYVRAFLFMIRACEHVYPRDVLNGACYSIFYGGSHFVDMSDHPVNTGEKQGVPLPDSFCAAVKLKPGCVSTAAGAYQFIRPTWNRIRDYAPRLPDFSPASQDIAAERLLMECGAYDYVVMGDFDTAITEASTVWASLPKSTAQQNPKRMQYARERFFEGLFV